MRTEEFAVTKPPELASMGWEDKEIEVASILLRMSNGLHLPGQEEDGVAKESQQLVSDHGITDDQKRKMIIVIPPKQQPESSTPPVAGTSTAGFPFIILSFLSAVRVALITPTAIPRKALLGAENRLPSLTFHQIMQRVRSNPGDDRVLEMTVRLQDLVRGVLRMFLSTTPPPGFAWRRPLVAYNKITKLWSWVGPVPIYWPRPDLIPTSSQAWGIRVITLNWLVDCYGHWVNATLRVLQEIASLPPPPLSLMPRILPEERYTETRNLKNSVLTIGPSSEVVRAYFQREETLRYSIPEQAFTYTTRDGMKSAVVPLKKCIGYPIKKARDHFVLKANRPPYFTVLCLVRDAAARLPHRSGTRSDICILARDSQFVKEHATDGDIKQVVVGALDRLHSEFDPCIKFDKDQRLWYYLHGDKEEEDFDENCTVSTKRTNY